MSEFVVKFNYHSKRSMKKSNSMINKACPRCKLDADQMQIENKMHTYYRAQCMLLISPMFHTL